MYGKKRGRKPYSKEKKSFIPGKPAAKPGFRKTANTEGEDRPAFRKSTGDKKSFGKPAAAGGKRFDKPFGEKRASGSSFGGKRSYGKPGDEKRGADKPYGDKRSYGRDTGEKRDASRSFGEKRTSAKPFGEKGGYRRPSDERRGSERTFGDKRNAGTTYGERRAGDRPSERKSGEARPARERRDYDKPFGERRNNDRKPVGRPRGFSGRKEEGDRFERREAAGFKGGFRDKKAFGRFSGESRPVGKREEKEEKPGFRKFSKSSEEPENNERQVGRKRPPRYDKEHLEKKAPFKAKDKIVREAKKEEDEEIRLNRYIANAGLCSRREADELIASGMIRVNGKVVTEMGYKVKDRDTVKYGKDILSRERMMYILLNKPKDYITTMDDPDERRTVMDLIAGACKERVYPVGRLDRNTTGLLLLTNDGELTEKLTHPSQEVKKIYQAELNKPFEEEHFLALKEGIELEDGFVKPDQLAYVTPDAEVVGLEIHSGKNRIVRRIFEHFGYEVTKLDRTTFAGLNKKELPRGKWRFLTEKEVIMLKYLL